MQTIPYLNSGLNLIYFNKNSDFTLIFCHGGAWITNTANDFVDFGDQFEVNVILLSYSLSTKPSTIVYPQAYLDIKDGLETIHYHEMLKDKVVTISGHSCGTHLVLHTMQKYKILPEIKRFVGVEGIYDIDKLVESFPSYREWFLDYVFVDRTGPEAYKDLSCCNNVLDLDYYLIYSLDDELIDSCQSDTMFEHLKSLKVSVTRIESNFGGHDEVLKNSRFLKLISTIVQW